MEIYFTFASTHTVILAEKTLLDGGFAVKVRPVPSEIKAGCGLCLCLPISSKDAAENAMKKAAVTPEAVYLLKDKQFNII